MAESRKAIQKRADDKRAGTRARAWTCLVYPDSAADEWQEVLRELLVECLISPLHDKDVWTKTDELENPEHKAGEPKKAHWHVVLSFKNPATNKKHKKFLTLSMALVVKKFQTLSKWQGIFAIWINLKNIAI